jgi:hypothetical protein
VQKTAGFGGPWLPRTVNIAGIGIQGRGLPKGAIYLGSLDNVFSSQPVSQCFPGYQSTSQKKLARNNLKNIIIVITK